MAIRSGASFSNGEATAYPARASDPDLGPLYVALFRGEHIMPSKSKAQHRLMEAVAHSEEFAKKTGIPQEVAKEFVKEDAKKPRKLPERIGDK